MAGDLDLRPEAAAARAAQHWNVRPAADRTRWWEVPAIIRHINRRVCGQPLDGLSAGARRWVADTVPGLPLDRAVSVGGGHGSKELDLIADGIVRSVDVFEIAEAQVERGIAAAEQRGLADRIRFHQRLLDSSEDVGPYDLVHWNNALHHMLDVDEWLGWSRRMLRDGGVLLMDDFVGATRFQWPRRQLDYATRYRRSLPPALLADPRVEGRTIPCEPTRPSIERMIAVDPTEAADSGRILRSLRRHFPDVEIRPTGGVIYHLALTDVVANFRSGAGDILLEQALLLDDALSDLGENHYAVAVARM